MEVPEGCSTSMAELLKYIRQGDQQRAISILLQQPNIRHKRNFHDVLRAAIETGGEDVIVWLLNIGYSKNTVLEICINNGNETFIKLLLDKGADLEEGLHFAVKANKNDVIKLLLTRGANINTDKRNCNTPLHTAILQKCDLSVVQLLIEKGANVNARNNNNRTAVDIVENHLETSNDADAEELKKIKEVLQKNKLNDNVFECLQGLPDGLSGYSYQIKLFTLYAIKNTKLSSTTQCQYELGTELKNLIPFDDVYLRRTRDGITSCEFVQVKQTKKPECNKLEEFNFFSILKCGKNIKEFIKGNGSIAKMFIKFAEIEQSHLQNGVRGQFIYCTNTHFESNKNICFATSDEISNVLCDIRGQKFKIGDWQYLHLEIKFILLSLIADNYVGIKKIENELKIEIETQIQILKNIEAANIKNTNIYESTLWSVFKITTEGANIIEKYLGHLNECKTKIEFSNDVNSVKQSFPEEIEIPHLRGGVFSSFKTACINKIKEVYTSLKNEKEIFKLFGKWDEKTLMYKIQNFVEHFSVYTACPTSDELDDIITKEINEEFKFHESKLLSNYCLQYFSKWISNFKNERGMLFKHEDGNKLFQDLSEQILKGFNKWYIEELQFNEIHFKNNTELLEFLNGNHSKILHVVTDYARLHAIKMFHALKNIENKATGFTYLNNALLTNSELIFESDETLNIFLNAFSSDVSNDLLVIEFFDDFNAVDNTYEILNKLTNIVTTTTKKKLIVIAKKDNYLAKALKSIASGSKSSQAVCDFRNLENNSQKSVLNKDIAFQIYPNESNPARKIKDFLNTTAACEVIDEELLSSIISKKEPIKIGSVKNFYSDEYKEKYYIPRRVHQQIVDIEVMRNVRSHLFFVTGITIRKFTSILNMPDVLIHTWEGTKSFNRGIILLLDTDSSKTNTHQEIYAQISNKCNNKNIYWLEYKKKIFFLKAMKNKMDTCKHVRVEDLEMNPESVNQEIVVLANNPGEGKSTMLTHLAHVLRKKYPYLWIIPVKLIDHADNTLPISLNDVTFSDEETTKAVKFFTRMVIQDNANTNIKLERKLLEGALNRCSKIRAVLLFDGFDEISPGYKDKTCTLIKALAKSEVSQIWITTRVHMKEYLEEQFQVPAYMMSTFTENEQSILLNKLWKYHLINYKGSDAVASDEQIILGILEQLTLCYKNCCRYNEQECIAKIKELSKLKLLDLQEYINDKVNLICYAKLYLYTLNLSKFGVGLFKVPLNLEMIAKNVFLTEWNVLNYQNIALFGLYKEFVNNQLNIYRHVKSISELGNQASKDQADVAAVTYAKMHREIAVKTFFSKSHYLPELDISKEYVHSHEKLLRIGLIKSFGNRMEFIHRNYCEYFFAEYLSVHLINPNVQSEFLENILINDDYHLVRTFFDGFLSQIQLIEPTMSQNYPKVCFLKKVLNPDVAKYIVAKKNDDCENILHIATRGDHSHIFSFIFNNITSTDFSELLLETASDKHSVLHLAILNGHDNELFRTVLETVESVPQIEKSLILKCDNYGNTCFDLAVVLDLGEICSIILKSVERHSDVFKEFIFKTIDDGNRVCYSALNVAASKNCKSVCEVILETMNKHLVFADLILKGDINNQTALHVAVAHGNIGIFRMILNSAEQHLFSSPVSDSSHKTPLHISTEVKLGISEKDSVLKDLIMRLDISNETAFHIAANKGTPDFCEIIMETAERGSILKDVIFKCGKHDSTVLHSAAQAGRADVCDAIMTFAKKHSFHNELLGKTNSNGLTALQVAADYDKFELVFEQYM